MTCVACIKAVNIHPHKQRVHMHKALCYTVHTYNLLHFSFAPPSLFPSLSLCGPSVGGYSGGGRVWFMTPAEGMRTRTTCLCSCTLSTQPVTGAALQERTWHWGGPCQGWHWTLSCALLHHWRLCGHRLIYGRRYWSRHGITFIRCEVRAQEQSHKLCILSRWQQ